MQKNQSSIDQAVEVTAICECCCCIPAEKQTESDSGVITPTIMVEEVNLKVSRRKKYYGVYAANGFGVYNNYDKLVESQTYMRAERIKSFHDKEDAEDFALIGFEELYGIDCRLEAFPDVTDNLSLNYFYFYRRKATVGR